DSISKVGKPDPPPHPRLTFVPFESTPPVRDGFYLIHVNPDKDGNLAVDFTVFNPSEKSAQMVDGWLDICDACSFVKEPDAFDRPTGMRDNTRHTTIQLLNPKASLPKKTVVLKLKEQSLSSFDIAWRYSCDLCEHSNQELQIIRCIVDR